MKVRVCCSVLQCVAVCCSVLLCAAVRRSVLQCVAVCCSVLQGVVLQCIAVCCTVLQHLLLCEVDLTCHRANTSRRVAGCCRVLQRVAVCCSVLQCVAVCCSVLPHTPALLQNRYDMSSSQHILSLYCCISRLSKNIGLFAKEPYKRDNILRKRPIFFFRPTAIEPTHPIFQNTTIALSCFKFLFLY